MWLRTMKANTFAKLMETFLRLLIYKCWVSRQRFFLLRISFKFSHQFKVPPSIDDLNSTPAGTITLKEGAGLTLKCYADGKPAPMIKWYRWKKYKKFVSDKEGMFFCLVRWYNNFFVNIEELEDVSNEIRISSIRRNDANIYECIAKNSVPPATSRIFNIEVQCKKFFF